MDDDLRLGPEHCLHDRRAIEAVGDGGLGAQRAQRIGLGRRARHGNDVVAAVDEHRDQVRSERSAGPGNEDPHGQAPCLPRSDSG
jgi:hypothetical protein